MMLAHFNGDQNMVDDILNFDYADFDQALRNLKVLTTDTGDYNDKVFVLNSYYPAANILDLDEYWNSSTVWK